MSTREYYAAAQRRKRDKRAANGLCVECAKRPPVDGGRMCEPCNDANRQRVRNYRTRAKKR